MDQDRNQSNKSRRTGKILVPNSRGGKKHDVGWNFFLSSEPRGEKVKYKKIKGSSNVKKL